MQSFRCIGEADSVNGEVARLSLQARPVIANLKPERSIFALRADTNRNLTGMWITRVLDRVFHERLKDESRHERFFNVGLDIYLDDEPLLETRPHNLQIQIKILQLFSQRHLLSVRLRERQ